MIPLIVVRPQPGCDATVEAALSAGLDALGFPLFSVRACGWQPPDPEQFDALLIGSANAIRLGGEGLAGLRSLPVLAVGEATAHEAREAGFTVAELGAGGMQPLLDRVGSRYPRLLRLSGRERITLSPPVGAVIRECIVYASEPLEMHPGLLRTLGQPCVVALHSAEAARHFAALCDDGAIERARIALAALGPRIAGAAGSGWADVRTAERPDDAALLAMGAAMCHIATGTQASGKDKGPP